MLRIRGVQVLEGHWLRLTLSDGSVVERDVGDLLWGRLGGRVHDDRAMFERARVRWGTVVWPGGMDVAPETLIWNGPYPSDPNAKPPARAVVLSPTKTELAASRN